MKKPLHKHPVFWIVTLVVLVVADLVQVAVSTAWIKNRSAALETAPRSEERPMMRPTVGFTTRTARGFDNNPAYIAKPGEWQVPFFDPSILNTAPTQVVILPTKFGPGAETRGSWSTSQSGRAVGVAMSPRSILLTAYEWRSFTRMILPDPMPTGQYDYLANLPSGSFAALQEEAKTKLGLVAERERRSMEVFVLRLNHPDAPGLKQVNAPTESRPTDPGVTFFRAATIADLTSYLEARIGKPVVDETGLTQRYEIRLPMVRQTGPARTTEWIEQTRQVVLEQLGLDMIPTNAPVEVLVVKKVSP